MAEYLENEVPRALLDTAKSLRKTEKRVTMPDMLEDDDVTSVTAGYQKKKGYARGYRVECPICRKNSGEGIDSWENSYYECSIFHCRSCDITWGVDKSGTIWEDFF